MTSNETTTSIPANASSERASKILKIAARIWFLVAFVGFILFAYYIMVVYGGGILNGDYKAWGEVSIKGHVPGDIMGNLVFISHMAMAVILSLGGIVQVIPQIRKRALHFHRWNGRLYIITAYLMSIGGLYLIWVRDSTSTLTGSISITINALLIIIFGTLAWRSARNHDVQKHRRWALRTFIVVSGVWFFRVGFMAWIIINQGPLGSTENLDGPFDLAWAFLNYLIPMAVLEGYFILSARPGSAGKYFMAGLVFLLTLITAVGIFGAYSFMWSPNM